ncbi:hypothetical protein LCM28_09865 [Salipiger pacificus]|nr:hypothetical protein [Alloyangia pacifica]
MEMTLPLKPHAVERAVERQIDRDAAWFRSPARRHKRFRLRRSVPHEFEIHEVGRGLTGTMTERLSNQADMAAWEAERWASDEVPITIVEQLEPGARIRYGKTLPKELFEQRHRFSEEAIRTLAHEGFLPLDCLL